MNYKLKEYYKTFELIFRSFNTKLNTSVDKMKRKNILKNGKGLEIIIF